MNDSGKVNVSEVHQNDLAFRMNTSLRKVLQEGVGSNEDDALEHKGFWDGADLCLGDIDTTNVNKRERGKKETIRKAPNSSNIASILK